MTAKFNLSVAYAGTDVDELEGVRPIDFDRLRQGI